MAHEPQRETASAGELARSIPWGRLALGYVLAYAAGVLGGLALVELGWWQGAGWERAMLRHAHALNSRWLDPLFLWLPWVGTNYALAPIVVVVVVALWRRGRRLVAAHLAVVQAGSWTLNPLTKLTTQRPRPELFEPRGQHGMSAYPSGHVIAVVAVLFTVAWLLDRHGRGRWGYAVVAAFLTVTAYSRVYLAVHWFTDVLGGLVVGGVWLAATLAAFRPLYHGPTVPGTGARARPH